MTRWGNFELSEEIGRGAFGAVYRSFHPTLGQEVALKLVPVPAHDLRAIEKALEEARRLASVRHHNVVVVHDAQYVDGYVGICMELVKGHSLDADVQNRGSYEPHEATACIRTLAGALSAVHRAHIVHNDVKAKNAIRETGGRVVLMDFGAGRRMQDPNASTKVTVIGTPLYMAPEIFRLRDPTPVSDIYSLGVLWFYLLTGQHPVVGDTIQELADAHLRGTRRFLGDFRDDVPPGLQRLVDGALQADPAARYQSCGALLNDLDGDWETDRPGRIAIRPVPSPEPAIEIDPPRLYQRRGSSDMPMAAAAAAAATVALLVAVGSIGFMADKAYEFMFGLEREFAENSPLAWIETGVQTLPLPLFFAIVALIGWTALSLLWRVSARNSVLVDTWSHRTSRSLQAVVHRAGIDDAPSLATLLLISQCVVFAVLSWWCKDVINAFTNPIVYSVLPVHALLSVKNDGQWLFFRGAMCLLTFVGGYAWWNVLRYRRPAEMGFTRVTAGIAVTSVSLALATVPWRVVQNSTFETAMYGSERCYVTAEKGVRLQLYCPDAPRTTRVIGAADQRLVRLGLRENVFSTVPAGRRTQEVP